MKKDLIIFGTANMTQQFLSEVDRFGAVNPVVLTVDRQYITADRMYDLPVVPYDELVDKYSPEQYDMLMVRGNGKPQVFQQLYERLHDGPYKLINYISPKSFTDSDLVMGDNNIVYAGADLGYGGVMGSCNVIRQQVYLGHEFNIGSFNTFRPGCKVGGMLRMGNHNEISLASVVRDGITIGDECVVGMGAVVVKNVDSYCTVMGVPAKVTSVKQHE